MARLKQMWVTDKFKQFAFEEKAMRPDKPLHEVLDEVAEEMRRRRGKKGDFPRLI